MTQHFCFLFLHLPWVRARRWRGCSTSAEDRPLAGCRLCPQEIGQRSPWCRFGSRERSRILKNKWRNSLTILMIERELIQEENSFLCTGGVYYVLYMALLISKLFWSERVYGWGAGGGYRYVTLLYVPLGEGGGSKLFWAQMTLASLAISGPKKNFDF